MANFTDNAVPANDETDKIIAVNINRIYKVREKESNELVEFQALKNVNMTIKKSLLKLNL